MPTFNLFIYFAAIAAAYIFKISYNGWFGEVFLWTAVLFPPVAFVLSLPSVLTGKACLSAPDRVFKGSEHTGKVELRSRFVLPIGRISMKVRIENRFTGEVEYREFRYSNMGNCVCSFKLPTNKCGLLVCSIELIEFSDILGMFRFRRRTVQTAACTVLPVAAVPERKPDIEAALDMTKSLKPKYGGGYSEDHEMREYRPGDTVRSIHWKLTSKTDEVIIREPLVSEKNEIYIVFSPEGDAEKSLSVLLWLSGELYDMELAHSIVWRHRDREVQQAHIVSHAAALDAAAGIVSSPCAKASVPDRARALCVFEVRGGEVYNTNI